MKKITLSLLACLAALTVTAAESAWLTDLSKAQAKAKAENKMLLMDFTGSDWCPPCMALKKKVLSSPEFESFAKTNLVLVEVDFPRRKAQDPEQKKTNEALAQKFTIEAFPTVIVFDSKGKELNRETGYGGTEPKAYVAKLKELKTK